MISSPWLVPKYLFIFPSPSPHPTSYPVLTPSPAWGTPTHFKCKQTKFILTSESLDWFFSCYFMIQNNKQRSCYKYLSDPTTASWGNGHTHKPTQGHVHCWLPTWNMLYKVPSTGPGIPAQTFHFFISLGHPSHDPVTKACLLQAKLICMVSSTLCTFSFSRTYPLSLDSRLLISSATCTVKAWLDSPGWGLCLPQAWIITLCGHHLHVKIAVCLTSLWPKQQSLSPWTVGLEMWRGKFPICLRICVPFLKNWKYWVMKGWNFSCKRKLND